MDYLSKLKYDIYVMVVNKYHSKTKHVIDFKDTHAKVFCAVISLLFSIKNIINPNKKKGYVHHFKETFFL